MYDSIKTQNEINKTPNERELNPAPSYKVYQTERQNLKNTDSTSDKSDSQNFNLK